MLWECNAVPKSGLSTRDDRPDQGRSSSASSMDLHLMHLQTKHPLHATCSCLTAAPEPQRCSPVALHDRLRGTVISEMTAVGCAQAQNTLHTYGADTLNPTRLREVRSITQSQLRRDSARINRPFAARSASTEYRAVSA
jgi:hypothetical protein